MNERKTVYKWFFVWDFEKEEQWLNEMALAGWMLDSVGWCRYTFRACEPGEYTVRLEMHGYDPQYVDFMSESGAEYVGRVLQWLYFRKKAADGPFDIFSDIDSKVNHLNAIARLLTVIGFMNLFIGALNAFNGRAIGAINLLLASMLTYGLGRIHEKVQSLKRDRQLFE